MNHGIAPDERRKQWHGRVIACLVPLIAAGMSLGVFVAERAYFEIGGLGRTWILLAVYASNALLSGAIAAASVFVTHSAPGRRRPEALPYFALAVAIYVFALFGFMAAASEFGLL